MHLIEHLPTAIEPATLADLQRDTLVMTSEERRWCRRRVTTAAGREVALALPTGTTLEPGAIIAIGRDWYLEVEAAPEDVFAVHPHDHLEAIRIAFEVGNHHFPLGIDHDELLVPDDTAMELLLTRLGTHFQRRRAIFRPIARGHVHE